MGFYDLLMLTAKELTHPTSTGSDVERLQHNIARTLQESHPMMDETTALQIAVASAQELDGAIMLDPEVLANATERWTARQMARRRLS